MESEKIKRNAKNLFINLYIRRYKEAKNSSKSEKFSVVRLATQSWYSLSHEETQIFIEQYKKHGTGRKAKIANYLKNISQTRIKKKSKKLELADEVISELPSPVKELPGLVQEEDYVERTFENTSNHDDLLSPVTLEPEYSSQVNATERPNIEISQKQLVVPDTICTGRKPRNPIPDSPAALNAQQLFNLINESREDGLPWDSLAKIDKTRYRDALLKLKRDYLKKYESYLHNLSSEELYYHMIDILSTNF